MLAKRTDKAFMEKLNPCHVPDMNLQKTQTSSLHPVPSIPPKPTTTTGHSHTLCAHLEQLCQTPPGLLCPLPVSSPACLAPAAWWWH